MTAPGVNSKVDYSMLPIPPAPALQGDNYAAPIIAVRELQFVKGRTEMQRHKGPSFESSLDV